MRRNFLLISLILVAVCILPDVYPYYYMLSALVDREASAVSSLRSYLHARFRALLLPDGAYPSDAIFFLSYSNATSLFVCLI